MNPEHAMTAAYYTFAIFMAGLTVMLVIAGIRICQMRADALTDRDFGLWEEEI